MTLSLDSYAELSAQLIVLVALPARLCGAVVREARKQHGVDDEAEAAYRVWLETCAGQLGGEDLALIEPAVRQVFVRAFLDARDAE